MTSHTQAIRAVFGADVDGDSASIAYQADQLAQKLDEATAKLAAAAIRAEGYALDIQRALVSKDPTTAASLASRGALLAATGVECAQLVGGVDALKAGLFALVQATGKGKQYVEAKK